VGSDPRSLFEPKNVLAAVAAPAAPIRILLRDGDKTVIKGVAKALVGCRKGNKYYLCVPGVSRSKCLVVAVEIIGKS
jgi:hypothetical protein